MNKKKAFEYLASMYDEVAEFVFQIKAKYFQKKAVTIKTLHRIYI